MESPEERGPRGRSGAVGLLMVHPGDVIRWRQLHHPVPGQDRRTGEAERGSQPQPEHGCFQLHAGFISSFPGFSRCCHQFTRTETQLLVRTASEASFGSFTSQLIILVWVRWSLLLLLLDNMFSLQIKQLLFRQATSHPSHPQPPITHLQIKTPPSSPSG